MGVYDFNHQMRQGDQAAEFLDTFFRGKGYAIRPATRAEQRSGIDRAFTSPKDGKTWLGAFFWAFRRSRSHLD